MFDFPVMFEHIQMALWRVSVEIERIMADSIDENGEVEWISYFEEIEVGIFLSQNMAKISFDSAKLSDYVSEDEVNTGKVYNAVIRFEMWHIDETTAAEQIKTIEEKQLK